MCFQDSKLRPKSALYHQYVNGLNRFFRGHDRYLNSKTIGLLICYDLQALSNMIKLDKTFRVYIKLIDRLVKE